MTMDRYYGQKCEAWRSGGFQGELSAVDGRSVTAAETDHHHKKPVAKLVPVESSPIDPFGCMAGTARICGDIIGPIKQVEWTGDADNV